MPVRSVRRIHNRPGGTRGRKGKIIMAETKKPAAKKTPATNAAPGVATGSTETEIRTFKSGGLPPIPSNSDDVDRIGHLADVAYVSGLFPGETPATLAIRILAGRSLGLDDAQALFDVETESPAMVRYRPAGRTFEQANDDVEATKAELYSKTSAAKGDPVQDLATPEQASPPAETASNVVKGPFPADNPTPIAIASQKIDDSANKGPLPIADGETPKGSNEPANDEARPVSVEARAESATTDEPAPGSETLNSALSAADAAADLSDVSVDTVKIWRSGIVEMCNELGIPPTEKTSAFDIKPIGEKRKMFEDCRKFYFGKVDASRTYVLERLREDGKTDADSQKGFFLYADVGFEPTAWNLPEAKKAEAAINEFLKSKGTRSNPAA